MNIYSIYVKQGHAPTGQKYSIYTPRVTNYAFSAQTTCPTKAQIFHKWRENPTGGGLGGFENKPLNE